MKVNSVFGKKLNAAAVFIRDSQNAVAADADIPGRLEFSGSRAALAEARRPFPIRGKNLNTLVAAVGYVHVSIGIQGDAARLLEVARRVAAMSDLLFEFTGR